MTTTPTTTAPTLASVVEQMRAIAPTAICPGNSTLRTTAEYQEALAEFMAKPLSQRDQPAFNRAVRSAITRVNGMGMTADRALSDADWLRAVLPFEVLVLLAAVDAEYAQQDQTPDRNLELDLWDGRGRFKVFAADGRALQEALSNLLLAERRANH